jgi:DNA-binding MarR family transcriptional regulator
MAVNNPISGLNKIFDNRVRLGVMSILMVNEEISFNDLKEVLQVTDGNLATHMQTLEEEGYIKVHKGFVGRKTNTTYSVTKAGEKSFTEHITALEKMIRGIK